MKQELQAMRVTPWTLKEIPNDEQPTAVMNRPQSTVMIRGEHILPMRKKPLTPSCSGCAHAGKPSHGFRHSVECRAAKRRWLDRQLGPPEAVEPEIIGSDSLPTRRRLTYKQPPETIGTKRMMELEDDPERVTSGETTMHCEEPGTSSTQVKHTAEERDESDAMVEFLEILNADAEDDDQTYIMLRMRVEPRGNVANR